MAYSPQTWTDGNASYPVSAARMGNIETGIQNAALVADQGVQLLTTSAKNALSPATGWMVNDTTLAQFQFWNGSAWQTFAGDTGWIAISGYTNSWVSNGGPGTGGTVAAYRRIGNVVRLAGTVKSGTTGNAVFTLPSGYRPPATVYGTGVLTVTALGVVQWLISTAGVVTPSYGGGGSVPSLDGVIFTVD